MNSLLRKIGKKVRTYLVRSGFDIVRARDNPMNTLLGLKGVPIKTVIDIGANRGQFAKKICEVFPEATVHCFEPLLEPFEQPRRLGKYLSLIHI